LRERGTLRISTAWGAALIFSLLGVLVMPPARSAPLSIRATHGTIWLSRYNGPANGDDAANDMAMSPDGSMVFVTGSSNGSGAYAYSDYATVAYDSATGMERWTKRYNGLANVYDYASSVAVSPNGTRVFVTGVSGGASGSKDDYATIAYDATTGAKEWLKRYNGPADGLDDAYSVAVSPDGVRVFVTGESEGQASGSDFGTVAYDAATGAEEWARHYNGPGNDFDRANSVAVSPDGARVFVTGESAGGVSFDDYATVAYDTATGVKQWVRRYNGTANGIDSASSVVVGPDGARVFVTGYSEESGTSNDFTTVAYDASTGAKQWVKRYNAPADGSDGGRAISVSPDGARVFVTGNSSGSATGTDFATVAYDAATGGKLWVKRYNGPANDLDWARSISVSLDGTRVYVTGNSVGAGLSDDYATVAYDTATGIVEWVNRYTGPGSGGRPMSVIVSPDGTRVFVTGGNEGSATASDYTTIAYAA
jgi:DNA-binding beta-propeller fold protein YncE